MFRYYGQDEPIQPFQGLQYQQPQQPQQQGQGQQITPEQIMKGYDMYQNFSGAGAGTGAAQFGGTPVASGSGMMGGGAQTAMGVGGNAAAGSTALGASQFGGTAVASGMSGGGGAAAAMGGGAGAGAGGASGMGGAAAAAGPWAALAAIIAVNEYNAYKGGHRSEDKKRYAQDLISGNVQAQDIERRWGPKVFGQDDADKKRGWTKTGALVAQTGSGDIGAMWQRLKEYF